MASSISTSSSTPIPSDRLQNEPPTHLEINTAGAESNTIDISITTEVTSSSQLQLQSMLPTQTQSAPLLQPLEAKHQMLPFVYIQTPSKLPLAQNNTINKTTAAAPNNIIQISSFAANRNALPTNLAAMQSNQGMILTKPQQLVLQKSAAPVSVQAVPFVPVSVASTVGQKNTVAYLTMIKPFTKSSELTPISASRISTLSKIKSDTAVQFVSNSNLVNNSSSQKFVIAPMPKVTTNRLPVTATTNTVQSKIALMPLTLQNHHNNNNTKHKIFNFKIADGKLQTDNNGTITVLCDNSSPEDEPPKVEKLRINCEEKDQQLVCNEVIDIVDSPEKPQRNEDKSYQLSIVEDADSRNDVSFTITIPDDPDKTAGGVQKETPKFSKHGVSILKRSFNLLERKPEKPKSSLIISPVPVPNSITTISDANTKEVRITTCSSFDVEDSVIQTNCPAKLQQQKPPERRRKSQFLCRKDYDEVEVSESKPKMAKYDQQDNVTITKLTGGDEDCFKKEPPEVLKEKPDNVNMNVNVNVKDDYDISKALNWEDGIGTLPGSDLKFQMNEFGFLEFLTSDEYNKILEKKIAKAKEKENKKNGMELDEMRCIICGCFGMASEFISPKYCSYDCLDAGEKAVREKELKVRRKKKKGYFKKCIENLTGGDLQKADKESTPSDGDTSNENSQDKFNYPWNCSKKGFSWSKYLEHVKAKSAPVKLFKDPFPYTRNGFRPGMKLEGIDPQHPSYFCVLTIAEVIGYRLRLHFDGYPENYDFWLNADSMDIFPAGWCEKYGHILRPPPTYSQAEFNWTNYLKQTKSTAAPKHLFSNRTGNSICPNGFRVGMKLEAVDRKNTALVCVATITNMMDNRLLIHFDSWDDIYDYWADPTSPYIHPVGWCDQYGHNLTPPNDYPHPESFTWEKYLKETKSVAAPARAFKQRPSNGFKRGMRLECVDKRVPQIIRVATVDDAREHQIRVSFDGWPDRYGYWVDDDSTDIHPVGWCHKTGHPLESPLTPDDVYDFLECPTVGCRGQGHIKGPKYATHSSQKHCPYADENIDQEHVLPDRLLSPDRQLESVVPVSREPREKMKPKLGRPPKIPRLDLVKQDWSEEDSEKKPKKKFFKKRDSPECIITKKHLLNLTNGFATLEQQQVWEKHSKYLSEYIRNDSDPRYWSEEEVVDFVTTIPSCRDHGAAFSKHNIDGESFLMLSQQDIVDILNIKLGPAIKLYNSIVLLRQNVVNCYT